MSEGKLLHFTKISENAMHSSYLVSLQIAQAGKPQIIGQSLELPAIRSAVGVTFGDKNSKQIERIPLSKKPGCTQNRLNVPVNRR